MSLEQKEIMQEATRQAKAAVVEARENVKNSLEELAEIQKEIERKRAEHDKTDPAELHRLEERMRDLQLRMTQSVEDASQQVQQATQEAKGKLGTADADHTHEPAKMSSGSFRASRELERQSTGAHGVLAPSKLTDKYSASSPRPSSSGSAHNPPAQQDADEDNGGGSTPSSARASQGIVGGFMFRANTTAEEDEDDDSEDESDEGDESDAGPTADDVTASMDESQESAYAASEGNKSAVQKAASDVKGAIKKDK